MIGKRNWVNKPHLKVQSDLGAEMEHMTENYVFISV